MKKISTTALMGMVMALCLCLAGSPCEAKSKAEKMGLKLTIQSFTFHKFSLMEALDKTKELGIKYIEVYPGHRLGGNYGDKTFDCNLSTQERKEIMQIAKQKGVKIVACGVFVSNDHKEWHKMFQFAKEMKMEYITCEPPLDMWDCVERMSKEYGIKVAVHNHPQPSDYWNPQNLLNAISQRSPSLGSCADVGHWNREGLNHMDCLNKLGKRVISFHFKDIVAKKEGQDWRNDCIWGTGVLDVKNMVRWMKQQGFKGYLAIEYEYNWENSVPDIRECIKYFNQTVEEL